MTATLYNLDALTLLDLLEPGSVDAIITDLPYGTTAMQWDEIIPFAPMWAGVKRVLKPRGAFVTTASQPFTSKLVMSNLEWFREEVIWDKRSPVDFMNVKIRHMKRHDNIIVFCDGRPTYNPQERQHTTKPFGKIYAVSTASYGSFGKERKNGIGYPHSIIEIQRPNVLTADPAGLHPTQKPVALYAYLIRTYTNPGDVVLDFCMGSGTTGVACTETGRNFIGSDSDTEHGYF